MADTKSVRICGMMKTTLLDFPGKVACTLFLAGCNMRCPFCHNPRVVYGNDEIINTEEVFSFLKKRRGILDGVCITGGEPTLYGDSLITFIKEIKELGYLVKLDTNGTSPSLLRSLIDMHLLDYVAMDVKSALTEEAYTRACGVSVDIQKIEESISLLKEGKTDFEFRTTVVLPLHTKEDIILAAKELEGGKRYFLQSFVDSGELISTDNEFLAMPKEEMEAAAREASLYIPTSVRGI